VNALVSKPKSVSPFSPALEAKVAANPFAANTLGALAPVSAKLGQVVGVAQLGVVAFPSSATWMVVETAPGVVGVPK
jgi:hypothetical protein